jgi:hypothetical protein
VHSSVAVYIGCTLGNIGVVLWSRYVSMAQLPGPDALAGHRLDRRRGHLGAWGGVLIAIFGKHQRNRALQELAHQTPAAGGQGRRLFPEVSAAASHGGAGGAGKIGRRADE